MINSLRCFRPEDLAEMMAAAVANVCLAVGLVESESNMKKHVFADKRDGSSSGDDGSGGC